MGKRVFGCLSSYEVGDRVWVYRCPRDGVGTVTKIRKAKSGNVYYEVCFDLGLSIMGCKTKDLKPATERESEHSRKKSIPR